jgi:hypothetical protein
MEYMESGVRIAFEPLLNINCSSEQTVDTARQLLFYDEDMPSSTVDLEELIDDLAQPEFEDLEPLIIGEPEFVQPVISAQQHLTQLHSHGEASNST